MKDFPERGPTGVFQSDRGPFPSPSALQRGLCVGTGTLSRLGTLFGGPGAAGPPQGAAVLGDRILRAPLHP